MRATRLARRRKQRGGTRKHVSKQPNPGPSQCHPAIKNPPAHGCLPAEVMHSAAQKLGVTGNLAGKRLRTAMDEKLGLKEPGERTFLNALPLNQQEKNNLARQYLRPPMPKEWISDPDMWLDSNNIADVMNQYEEAHTVNGVKEFEFMGPFPIDFSAPDPYARDKGKCLMHEICEIRVQKMIEKGTKYIGIVYNLDPHFKSGSHWVASFIDIPKHECYFFDSYGQPPEPQIANFMKWLKTQDAKMTLKYNKRPLQRSNTECGMYCIYMIIRMLEGDSFVDITRRKPNDHDMLDYRDWLFST